MKALILTMMESGKQFVRLLDENFLNPKAAFWIYHAESDDWKLLVGHVNIVDDDDAMFNKEVSALFTANPALLSGLKMSDIVLALNDAPILELINSVVNTGDEILGIPFNNEEINGVVLDGIYLYRMNITELV